jgi:hypothetical protein
MIRLISRALGSDKCDTHAAAARANIGWVEKYCLIPSGPGKGQPVRLSGEQRAVIRRIYDHEGGVAPVPVGPLAAYLTLLHVCGPEAVVGGSPPQFEVDFFTLWASATKLRPWLERDGEHITCPALGTGWPRAA